MTIKELINKDLKSAMLAGEKDLVTTLRGLKSAILYAEVAAGSRGDGISEQEVITLFQKEAKKRQESAVLYRQGGNEEKALNEEKEKEIIEKYLPAQLSEEKIKEIIDNEAGKIADLNIQKMGQLIGAVKAITGGAADGALIAKLVKEKLS